MTTLMNQHRMCFKAKLLFNQRCHPRLARENKDLDFTMCDVLFSFSFFLNIESVLWILEFGFSIFSPSNFALYLVSVVKIPSTCLIYLFVHCLLSIYWYTYMYSIEKIRCMCVYSVVIIMIIFCLSWSQLIIVENQQYLCIFLHKKISRKKEEIINGFTSLGWWSLATSIVNK